MTTHNCILVEDEPLAQRVIQKHITQHQELQLVATVENALKAIEIINQTKIDLLFLDITLPVMNGIDFIKLLKKPPLVIFTTAYSEFAVTSYELEAVDYLLKPVTYERFAQAIMRFLRLMEKGESKEKSFLFIKDGGKSIKVWHDDIIYIEARKDYLLFSTPQQRFLTYSTMKAMEEQLPPEQFIRIHRSYIINKKAIESISPFTVEISGTTLPIGEKYKRNLQQEFRKSI